MANEIADWEGSIERSRGVQKTAVMSGQLLRKGEERLGRDFTFPV